MLVHRRHRTLIICAAIMGAFTSLTEASPLADRVPADALLYCGWAGSQVLGTKYDGSHLKTVLDASSARQLFTNSLPILIEKLEKQNPQQADTFKQVLGSCIVMFRHPSALYVGPIDMAASPPAAHVALLCDAGDEADALLTKLSAIIVNQTLNSPPLVAKKFGSLVVFSIGQPESWVTATFNTPTGEPLSKSPAFTAALEQVDADAPSITYVDAPAIVKQVDDMVPMINNPKATENWPKIRDGLDLDSIKQIAASFGFDNGDWSSQVFIGGSNAAFQSPALSIDVLKMVPRSAVRVAAGHFDLSRTLSFVHAAVQQFDPDTGRQFDDTLAKVNAMAGLDVQHDLLDSLGDQWMSYADNAVAGPGTFGFVIVNKLKNPAHAATALDELSQRANSMMAQAAAQSQLSFEFKQMPSAGATIHYLSVPFVSPSWAIAGDKLYLGLYPQVVDSALRFAAGGKPTILENEKFVALQKRFGDHPVSSVSYLDLPTLAPQSYGDILAISQLYLGGLNIVGGDVSPMVMPPLDKLLPELAPSASASWSDAAGYHVRGLSPFPGSDAFGSTAGASAVIGESALMTSILLPSLNRARETANRVKCASNERQIGQAILLYSNDNRGKYPDHLGELIEKDDLTPEVFTCPSANSSVPPNVATMSAHDKAEWVEQNGDYIYIGKGMTSATDASKVVLYEKSGDHNSDGVNMLFADGHVEFETIQQADELLQKQGASPLP